MENILKMAMRANEAERVQQQFFDAIIEGGHKGFEVIQSPR